jgi:hypothetical protein
MAIDKIKLRALAKDKDERLFAEGDMLDAKNITVSTEGESTSGVVKNVKSTVPGTAATTADQIPDENARVIGSISDHSRGKVYFFVWSFKASNHGIYQYDTDTDTYKVVLRSSVFNFPKLGFVKADLINGDFQKTGSTQTIVYFTDNDNPPRKINVDRAISGDFSEYSVLKLEHAISAIKSPSLFPPTVSLETDTSRTTNNLYGSVLQFAVQYIYKDGEYSVLSPHSKVVYPKHMTTQGIVEQNSSFIDGAYREENLAKVNTRWTNVTSPNKDEVSKIRLLARNLNTNPFFVIDEFDPNSNLTRNGDTIYSSASGIYDFYNDGLYQFESSAVTDKVFDDVPQKAAGQAIAGNRMMYSSPNSGYDNVDVSASISVNYENEPPIVYQSNVASSYSDLFTAHNSIYSRSYQQQAVNSGKIVLDMSSIPSSGVTAGTIVNLEIEYKPSEFMLWGYYDASGGSTPANNPLYTLDIDTEYPGWVDGNKYVGQATDSANIQTHDDDDAEGAMVFDFSWNQTSFKSYSVSVAFNEDATQDDVLSAVANSIENEVNTYSITNPSGIRWRLRSTSGAPINWRFFTKEVDFSLSFDASVNTGGNIELTPKIWNIEVPLGELHSSSTGFTSSDKKIQIKNIENGTAISGSLNSFSLVPFFNSSVAPKQDIHERPLIGVENKFLLYEYATTPQREGLSSFEFLVQQAFSRRTFKAGSDHKFGVVYFDEYGRPGYVNDLGTVYVKPFGDSGRNGNNGPCTISIGFNSQPPPWAKTYQIVYADMGSWESFETFVVGGAHLKNVLTRNNASAAAEYVLNTEKIYLSLNTLVKYQVDKGALKDYVYTPGDKVRIINYRNTTSDDAAGTNTYLASSDRYIYDVIGIETLVNHIDDEIDESDETIGVHTNKRGKFLVVSPPNGQQVLNFDPTGAQGSVNKWNNEVLVEILTPRKQVENLIYYEIGESRPVLSLLQVDNANSNRHNNDVAIELTEGSVYYGPRPVVTPNIYSGNGYWSSTNIEDFDFDVRAMESMDASDFVASRGWSKGRAHIKYDEAANTDYPNRIVYSAEFSDPLGNITFNDFNPGSLSFKDLPRNFGAVNYINEYNQNLVALQENKLSLIPVSRNVIEYADGSSAITANKSVLGVHKEANGDFGVGSDQSSVFLRDGMIFFADRSRQKILMAAGANMIPISDIEMSSFFEDEFKALAEADGNGGRIVTGYDPEDNILFVTVEPKDLAGETYAGFTAGYSISDKRWISRYDFKPSNYATIDNKMLSGFKYIDTTHYLFNSHSGTTRNQFYGTSYPSSVKVVSKLSPSQPKVFNALSYEGSSGSWSVADEGISTNLNQNSKGVVVFTEKEGSYYAQFPKAKADNYVYIGEGVSNDGATITLSNMPRLNRLGVRASGLLVYWENNGTYTQISTSPAIQNYSQTDGTISIVSAPGTQDFVGKDIYVKIDNDEDSMRGHWAEIELSNSSTSAHELYCVNTHITPSKLHHPLGQQ